MFHFLIFNMTPSTGHKALFEEKKELKKEKNK